MASTASVVVLTEQQCSWSTAGTLVGRAPLGAVQSLAERVSCTLVARVSSGESGVVPLLLASNQVGVCWKDERSLPRLAFQIWRAVGAHRAVVVYLPGLVGILAGVCAVVRRRSLVVVCVGNAAESLSRHVLPGFRGVVARGVFHHGSSWLLRRAAVARYVTSRALQGAYPPGPDTKVVSASDAVSLDVTAEPRDRPAGKVRVLTVASMDQPYKGVPELVQAIIELRRQGHDVVLRIAGTGRLRGSIEQVAAPDPKSVEFLGHLGPAELVEAYSSSDIFALASWTEGMPRALVEAMASGLPAIATDVGGVSELLAQPWLRRPRDQTDLVHGLADLLRPTSDWRTISADNIARARALWTAARRGDQEFVDAVSAIVGAER